VRFNNYKFLLKHNRISIVALGAKYIKFAWQSTC